MFRVVFYDVRRVTFEAVSGVVQLSSCQFRIQGRLTNVLFLHLEDHTTRSFPQRWYQIHRIES